jgi:hypothetical protein
MHSFPGTFLLVAAIEVTASAAVLTAVLSSAPSDRRRDRLAVATLLGAWFWGVVALGATSALDAQHGAGVIGLGLAVALPLGALGYFVIGRSSPRPLDAVPLPMLIAVNGLRVLGMNFLLLHAARELPAPFAPLAGWGDILIGLTALPLSWRVARAVAAGSPSLGAWSLPGGWLRAWNALGVLDLVTALALGATSSPGPLRLFAGPPSSAIMTTLPWIIIPCFLVPIFLALHMAIFLRLRGLAENRAIRAAAWRAPGYR